MDTTITQSADKADEGQVTGAVEGQDEGAAASDSGKTEKMLTQTQVNELIQARLAEERARITKKLERDWQQKLDALKADTDKVAQEKADAILKERELAATRKTIQSEYGLTDKQLAVLEGDTEEALRAAAEDLFGALKKAQPPVVPTGANQGGAAAAGVFTRSQLRDPKFFREHRVEIMTAAREGRIVED